MWTTRRDGTASKTTKTTILSIVVKFCWCVLKSSKINFVWHNENCLEHIAGDTVFGVKCEVAHKYVWNQHLLDDVKDVLHPDWLLCVTHGFIAQASTFSCCDLSAAAIHSE